MQNPIIPNGRLALVPCTNPTDGPSSSHSAWLTRRARPTAGYAAVRYGDTGVLIRTDDSQEGMREPGHPSLTTPRAMTASRRRAAIEVAWSGGSVRTPFSVIRAWNCCSG